MYDLIISGGTIVTADNKAERFPCLICRVFVLLLGDVHQDEAAG